MKTYRLEIYRKPLEAIQSGKKKVEIRTTNSYEQIDYALLAPKDIIKFQIISGPPFKNLQIIEKDVLDIKVTKVINYKTPRELLEEEGLNVLSNLAETLEEGEEMLYSFHEYREMIPVHGIFAIHFDLVK